MKQTTLKLLALSTLLSSALIAAPTSIEGAEEIAEESASTSAAED